MDKLDFYPSSPVPADEFLWEDELPFTAFGQHGEGNLDLRVFEQSVWWVDVRGKEHLLREMSQEYLFNVKNHLLTNGVDFHRAMKRRHSIEQLLGPLTTVLPGAPEEQKSYKEFIDSRPPVNDSWELWLRDTPLFTRIEELLIF